MWVEYVEGKKYVEWNGKKMLEEKKTFLNINGTIKKLRISTKWCWKIGKKKTYKIMVQGRTHRT